MKKSTSKAHGKSYCFITKGKFRCSGCAACVAICPVRCITMQYDKEGFAYPNIDRDTCIKCKKCINLCCTELEKKKPENIYAMQSLDQEVLKTSSSGGLFTELCREFVKTGGYVSAALFDEDYLVKHVISNDLHELSRCRGAKYLQSDTTKAFQQLPKMLATGKKVMFVGTPCQTAAAVRLAGHNRDKLFTVSFICHGVPSPAVWKKYLDETKGEHNAKIKSVEMRNKDMGWQSYSMKVLFDDGSVYQKIKRNDIYLKGFLSDLYLRPSCHECQYKGENNSADIVFGDCWGIEKLELPLEVSKGVSIVLVQTDKGKQLIDVIRHYLKVYTLHNSIISTNDAYLHSALPHKKREHFFEQFSKGKKSMTKLIQQLCTPSIWMRIKKYL